jgi:integrase/recombinase XerD
VVAGLAGVAEHALVSLLALNGLRVSEAVGEDVEALSVQRGHRTLAILRKGGCGPAALPKVTSKTVPAGRHIT